MPEPVIKKCGRCLQVFELEDETDLYSCDRCGAPSLRTITGTDQPYKANRNWLARIREKLMEDG